MNFAKSIDKLYLNIITPVVGTWIAGFGVVLVIRDVWKRLSEGGKK